MMTSGDILDQARAIVAQGPDISYPSRAAAQHVRNVMRGLLSGDWQKAETAPKDGSHILAAFGPYDKWTGFDQRPPIVCHYFADPEEPGFYPSYGIVQDSYNDKPIIFTDWRPLGLPPTATP